MSRGKISVRQWQERFKAGSFDSDGQAGWEDFYDPLNDRRLHTLARLVMGVTNPFILDHHYVWFKDNTPAVGPFYGDVRFMPLDEDAEKYFLVSLDSPHERTKRALITQRYGYGAPEFECKDVRQMIRYVNRLGPELEQGIKPPFIAEKFAVGVYALMRGESVGIHIYREGDHRYSYTSFQDGRRHMIRAAASPEDVPPGSDSEEIRGIYVWRVEDEEKALPAPGRSAHKSHRRKEAER